MWKGLYSSSVLLFGFIMVTKPNKRKQCGCGCGSWINFSNKNGELFFKQGHGRKNKSFKGEKRNQLADKNNNWKGGKIIDGNGYVLIRQEGHPKALDRGKYVREHVLIMENKIGRYLQEGEIVHHINGIKSDNRLENLILMKTGKHSSLHRKKEIRKGRSLFGRKQNSNSNS